MSNAPITFRPTNDDLKTINRIIEDRNQPGLNLKPVNAIRIALAEWAQNHPEETAMTKIKIMKINTRPELDPYHRDTGIETKCSIEFDPTDGTVVVDQEMDDNATPEPAWSGRILLQTFAGHPREDQMRHYLESDGEKLLQQVAAGHSIDWDGSNHVGRLTSDASKTWDQLIAELSDLDDGESGYQYVDAGDWYGDCSPDELGVTAGMTDEELIALAKKLDGEQDSNLIVEGTYNYLESLRDELRKAAEE